MPGFTGLQLYLLEEVVIPKHEITIVNVRYASAVSSSIKLLPEGNPSCW